MVRGKTFTATEEVTNEKLHQLVDDATLSANDVATSHIQNDAASNAKLANMAANTLKANATGSTADPQDVAVAEARIVGRATGGNIAALTGTQTNVILPAFTGDSGSGGVKGLVPAPSAGQATYVLKGDGTFQPEGGAASTVSRLMRWVTTPSG
jgi:hypothetical protein